MLHACVERFDVMCVRGNILGWEGSERGLYFQKSCFCPCHVTWTVHALRSKLGRKLGQRQGSAPRTWRGIRADRLHTLLYSGRASTNTTGDRKAGVHEHDISVRIGVTASPRLLCV
jgi:hypothetical protein